jgi:hypothetical protein
MWTLPHLHEGLFQYDNFGRWGEVACAFFCKDMSLLVI